MYATISSLSYLYHAVSHIYEYIFMPMLCGFRSHKSRFFIYVLFFNIIEYYCFQHSPRSISFLLASPGVPSRTRDGDLDVTNGGWINMYVLCLALGLNIARRKQTENLSLSPQLYYYSFTCNTHYQYLLFAVILLL